MSWRTVYFEDGPLRGKLKAVPTGVSRFKCFSIENVMDDFCSEHTYFIDEDGNATDRPELTIKRRCKS